MSAKRLATKEHNHVAEMPTGSAKGTDYDFGGSDLRCVVAVQVVCHVKEEEERGNYEKLHFQQRLADQSSRRNGFWLHGGGCSTGEVRGANARKRRRREGIGLPPYEALHAGIPAIASVHLPSAAFLSGGVKLLERMDPASIAAAVAALLDDATAARLWEEAAGVRLPTWATFGSDLNDWAQTV